jgi:hypothetical protein
MKALLYCKNHKEFLKIVNTISADNILKQLNKDIDFEWAISKNVNEEAIKYNLDGSVYDFQFIVEDNKLRLLSSSRPGHNLVLDGDGVVVGITQTDYHKEPTEDDLRIYWTYTGVGQSESYAQFVMILKALIGFYFTKNKGLQALTYKVNINSVNKVVNFNSLIKIADTAKTYLLSIVKSKDSDFKPEIKAIFRSNLFNTVLAKYMQDDTELDYYAWANLYLACLEAVDATTQSKDIVGEINTIQTGKEIAQFLEERVKTLILNGSFDSEVRGTVVVPDNTEEAVQ